MSLPDESLAFILADNGYDVWISNGRGTRFSRGHASIDPYDSVLLSLYIILHYVTLNLVLTIKHFILFHGRLIGIGPGMS